jgi:hypothetical protein
MMSGTDLPIKRIDFINDFFEKNNGKEFLTFFDRRPEEIIERIEYRYFFVDFRENSLFRHLNAISLNLQKHFHLLRRLPEGVVLKKGEGWCSLTSKAVDFLLSNKPFIEKYFSYSFIGVESYKHTLLWNSPFRKNISDLGNLSLILWPDRNNPHPHVFNASDEGLLRSSSALFARKFSKDYIFEP